jgi:hypothetical protein
MGGRGPLALLVVAATAAFVVGTAIERNSGADHHDTAAKVARPPGKAGATEGTHAEAGGESPAAHAKETSAGSSSASAEKPHAELRPLGIDIEAWPFVALAALAAVGLVLASWLRPQLAPLLGLAAVTMLAFAALDIREVLHQHDLAQNGLAVLAGGIAVLHIAAAVVAATMASRAWRPHPPSPGPAGTMPA